MSITEPRAVVLALILCWAWGAQAEVPVPPLSARVTDLTGSLDAQQIQALDERLRAFEARKGSQIAVLLVPTTAPETIEQYGIRVADQWKIGRQRVDDGAILIVAKNDRTVRIEVGYGLEGVLTDATSKDIVSDVIIPRFRRGEFYEGISAGVDRMIAVIGGEALPPAGARDARSDRGALRHYAPVVLLMALVIGGILRSALGRVPGAVVTGGVIGGVAWLAVGALSVALLVGLIAFFFTLLGGGMVGPLIGGMGRGGFGGGDFGGGFTGGGGGFGGGGASGRW